jgi:hypothetical protein
MLFAIPFFIGATATAQADDTISVEALLQATPQGDIVSGGGASFELGRLFIAGEGRGLGDGAWSGRATGGLDLLGRSDRFDLTLGLFAGMTGGLVPDIDSPSGTWGVEAGLGAHVGHFHARYRRAMGMSGPMSGMLTEDELRLGVGFGEEQRVRAFGQAVHFQPGAYEASTAFGGGVSVAF